MKKLNTLVRAQIEGFFEDDLRLPAGSRRREAKIQPDDPRLKRDIRLLREQIDAALDREEMLQEQLDALRQSADDLSQQADVALQQQEEVAARRATAALRQTEQQTTLLEADLTHHRHMTAALMDQVNILESQLAAANRPARAAAPPANASTSEEPAEEAPAIRVPVVVNLAPEKEETPPASSTLSTDENPPAPAVPTPPPDDADLATRRARLTRREPPQEE